MPPGCKKKKDEQGVTCTAKVGDCAKDCANKIPPFAILAKWISTREAGFFKDQDGTAKTLLGSVEEGYDSRAPRASKSPGVCEIRVRASNSILLKRLNTAFYWTLCWGYA